MEYIWEILTPTLTAIGTGLAGWIFARSRNKTEIRQLKAELEGSKIDNLNKAAESYEHIIEYIRKENERLVSEMQQNRDKMARLLEEQNALKTKIMELTLEVNRLNAELSKYKNKKEK